MASQMTERAVFGLDWAFVRGDLVERTGRAGFWAVAGVNRVRTREGGNDTCWAEDLAVPSCRNLHPFSCSVRTLRMGASPMVRHTYNRWLNGVGGPGAARAKVRSVHRPTAVKGHLSAASNGGLLGTKLHECISDGSCQRSGWVSASLCVWTLRDHHVKAGWRPPVSGGSADVPPG